MGRVRTLFQVDYTPLSEDHKAKLSASHRAWWGAPEGMATVRGVHVPLEHREPLAFFGNRIAQKASKEMAQNWVQKIKDANWAAMPKLREQYQTAMTVHENRSLIRDLDMEVYRAKRDGR